MSTETTPYELRAQQPHPFVESASLFASERLLCGHCNREIYNPVHVTAAVEPTTGGDA